MSVKNKFHYKRHTIEYEPVQNATQSAVNALILSDMIRDIVKQELAFFIQNEETENEVR